MGASSDWFMVPLPLPPVLLLLPLPLPPGFIVPLPLDMPLEEPWRSASLSLLKCAASWSDCREDDDCFDSLSVLKCPASSSFSFSFFSCWLLLTIFRFDNLYLKYKYPTQRFQRFNISVHTPTKWSSSFNRKFSLMW